MKCSSRNKIIYVRSEGYYSTEREQAVFKDLTLSECADRCTFKIQGVNCTSFEYDAIQLRCVLKEGYGNMMSDGSMLPLKTLRNISLFQQLCLPDTSEEHICPSPYIFERLPRHVLMGIAKEVMQVGSIEECLNMCLAAKMIIEIECRSVMYYYDTGECILNDENRATSTGMITNDTMDMRVDYFENTCFDVQCSTDFTAHWVKVGRFTISGDKSNLVMKQVTKEQCFNYCLENKIDDQRFPCKLYAYNENRMTCHLTSESGLIHSTTFDDNQKIYDDSEKYDYYEKICLKGLMRCQDSSFEHVANHALLNIGNKVITTSMTSCLEICLRSGKQCSSVMFFKDKDECVLSKRSQYSSNEQLRYFPEVDYFDNVCDYRVAINVSLENKIIEISTPIPAMHRQLNELETECGAAGILISVLFSKPTVGAIFIKDHFATCRSEFNNAMNATMEIALSTLRQDNPPCPGYETVPFINPSTWSFIVVVQKNGLGIPGLMTDEDRVFNITCDYSNGQTTNDSAEDSILLQDVSRDWLSTTSSNDVRLTVFRGDQPVSTAVMGEELEMRWTVMQDRMDNIGLFVNRCIAERLDGTPPLPPPLTLIADGQVLFTRCHSYHFFSKLFHTLDKCIDSKVSRLLMQHPITQFDGGLRTKIKVFRFDGSRRVRILCSVDICIEECLPVTCDKEVNGSLTNRDKKKRETFAFPTQQTSHQRIKREIIIGTFTIVEENGDLVVNENVTKIDEQSLNENMVPLQFPDDNQFCVQNFLFFILIAVTLILLTTQIFLLCKYMWLKTQEPVSSGNERNCNITSTPQHVYFGHEECCPAEPRLTLSKIIRQKFDAK
uniref:PAN domain-containing protein n=1 Tax=Wuchereria bancrofti TaxID=6293 RepID=A0A1I8EY91_WUCBA